MPENREREVFGGNSIPIQLASTRSSTTVLVHSAIVIIEGNLEQFIFA